MSTKKAAVPQRNAPRWIKVFVVIHILGITMWSLPYPKKPYMQGTAQLGVDTSNPRRFAQTFSESMTEGVLYFNWKYLKGSPLMYYPGIVGFWQYWDMFAPNPASDDSYLTSEVEFKDGTKKMIPFVRIYDLSIPMKYVKERYRKYYENASQAEQGFARPALAQRIALDAFTDPNNPPVKVSLHHHKYRIAPPGKPVQQGYTDEMYYSYIVDEAKLRQDSGLKP